MAVGVVARIAFEERQYELCSGDCNLDDCSDLIESQMARRRERARQSLVELEQALFGVDSSYQRLNQLLSSARETHGPKVCRRDFRPDISP